jgi:hypothetical protein
MSSYYYHAVNTVLEPGGNETVAPSGISLWSDPYPAIVSSHVVPGFIPDSSITILPHYAERTISSNATYIHVYSYPSLYLANIQQRSRWITAIQTASICAILNKASFHVHTLSHSCPTSVWIPLVEEYTACRLVYYSREVDNVR